MIAALFAATLALLNPPDPQSPTPTPRDPAWERLVAAKKQFQRDFCAIMADQYPEMKILIELSRDLQLAYIDAHSERFYHLLQNHPDRIVRTKGLSAFTNFRWEDSDEHRLLESNPEYRRYTEQVKKLRETNDGHPLWPEARKRFASLRQSQAYSKLQQEFEKARAEVEQLLARHPDDETTPSESLLDSGS